MSRKEVFERPSSLHQIPDLSLHISPPKSAPSSICTGTNEGDSSFDIWQKEGDDSLKSHSDSSIRAADTELSLSTALEAESPWRRNFLTAADQQFHINHGISLLNVSEGATVKAPIKGIPVYNNSSFPFSPLDRFNPTAAYPPSFRPCRVPSGFEAMSRYNGITMESLIRPQQFQYMQQQQQDFSNGFMRSRCMPKLQSKRNMRAPRMRWTTSLHARFVHAVELLGGHESIYIYTPSLYYFSYIFFLSLFPLIVAIVLLTIRGYTKVSFRAHGCQRSNTCSCQEPFTGTTESLKTPISFSLSLSLSLYQCVGVR
jgi:hypothetical protein